MFYFDNIFPNLVSALEEMVRDDEFTAAADVDAADDDRRVGKYIQCYLGIDGSCSDLHS